LIIEVAGAEAEIAARVVFLNSRFPVSPMLMLTAILLQLLGVALGMARRPWWEIGVLTLLAWALLLATEFWMGHWRRQAALPDDDYHFEPQAMVWLLVGIGSYVCYGLAFLYSRRRLVRGTQPDR
jgi:hypothetical protein